MQVVGLGLDIVPDEHMNTEYRQNRLAHGFRHIGKGLLCDIRFVIPNSNIKTGGCYDIAK